MFNRKKLSDDFVELKLPGDVIRTKVKFYELTNGLANKIINKSTIIKDVINENFMLTLFEYNLTNLKKKQIDTLTPKEGSILRNKIKLILQSHGLIEIQSVTQPTKEDVQRGASSESVDLFKKTEVEWFNKEAVNGLERAKKSIQTRGR